MTIKELAQKQGIAPGKIVDEFRKKYPGQKWTIDSELPFDFVTHYEEFEKTQPQEPVAQVGESAIATAEEAFDVAAYKLIEAEKIIEQAAIEDRIVQSELIGEAAGAEGGLKFVRGFIRGKQTVLNKFGEQRLQNMDTVLSGIDKEVFALADDATEILGKAIRQKQVTENKRQALQLRVAGLSKNMT